MARQLDIRQLVRSLTDRKLETYQMTQQVSIPYLYQPLEKLKALTQES
jgi:hypothetical protein